MLHNTLLPEEPHLLNVLVNDVPIRLRVGKETGEEISTLLGIMQGDCLSSILFIVYLAQVMTPNMPIPQAEHSYAKNVQLNQVQILPRKPAHKEDAFKPQSPNHRKPFIIDIKYADDTTWLTVSTSSVSSNISKLEENIPPMLKEGT